MFLGLQGNFCPPAATMEDVKKSGYYYMICTNIEEAWRLCDPDAEHKEDDHIPSYEDCDQISEEGEIKEQCKSFNKR